MFFSNAKVQPRAELTKNMRLHFCYIFGNGLCLVANEVQIMTDSAMERNDILAETNGVEMTMADPTRIKWQ